MSDIIITEKDSYSFYLGFLRNMKNISDPEFPGKFWTSDQGSECYADFDEMYMCFMSPCEYILKWRPLSQSQRSNLQKLYRMLESYDSSFQGRKKTDEEIRNDPEWHKIREFAKVLYNDLKNVKYVPQGELDGKR